MNAEYAMQTAGLAEKTTGRGTGAKEKNPRDMPVGGPAVGGATIRRPPLPSADGQTPASGPGLPFAGQDGEMWTWWLDDPAAAEPAASPLEDYVRELQQGFEEQGEETR
jgi:hypothetical protein